MSRITLTDTLISAITKMSDGNPGALNTMMEIMSNHDQIDPQAVMGGIGAIMMFDTLGIYGTDIYVLFNDKCKRDVRRLLMLLRATQMGLFSCDKLKEMAADQMRQIDLTEDEYIELDDLVCSELVDFQKRCGV